VEIGRKWAPLNRHKIFCAWLSYLEKNKYFKHIVVVSGNHERTCGDKWDNEHIEYTLQQIPSVSFLTFKTVTFKEFGDLSIAGLSWWDRSEISSTFKNFQSLPPAFTIDPHGKSNSNASHISILISHHPPYGILDEWHGNHKGSKRIVEYLNWLEKANVMPQYHIFGHVHKLGKSTQEIMQKSSKHAVTHINVGQSVGIMDYYY